MSTRSTQTTSPAPRASESSTINTNRENGLPAVARDEMQTFVHPSAIVSPRANIGADCYIGAYSIVGDDVTLDARVRLESHVVVEGRTTIGTETRVYPFVSIGLAPQDLKYADEPTETRVGARNQIREFVTIHRGTAGGGGVTTIGDDCLLMAQAHVAHDCTLGDQVIMANAATLAGHVHIETGANVGAYSGVHQFCRVGREAYIGGYSVIVKDALPFALTVGNRAACHGINFTGLKRRAYDQKTIRCLHRAFHLLLAANLNTTQAVEAIRREVELLPEIIELLTFIETSKRGVTK